MGCWGGGEGGRGDDIVLLLRIRRLWELGGKHHRRRKGRGRVKEMSSTLGGW